MATWIYPFFKISDEIIRPWVPIKITSTKTGETVTIMALLDTGADHCVFPQMVSDQTKLNLKDDAISTESMQGLAETKIDVWKHSFTVELLSPDRKSSVWKSKEIVVGCVDHDKIPPILGFTNFMCNFKITLNHATKKIIIDDRPKI